MTTQAQMKFLTGSTMHHVLTMTATGAIGLIAVFVVDLLNLFYISRLGHKELAAAIGYSGTLLFFVTSIAIGISIAATALTSRALGRGDRHQAKQLAGASLILMATIMVCLIVLSLPFLNQLIALLGATGETARLAVRFMYIVLPSSILLGLGMCLSALLRSVGDARRAMYVTLGAGAATAVLDPIFIFGFNLGIDGAAIATSLARVVMVVLGFNAVLKIHGLFAWPPVSVFKRELKPFMAIALPAVLTQIATPVGNAFVTQSIAQFGDSAVAGWAVIGRVIPVAFVVLFALSGSIGAILGQNYGAKRFDRLRSTMNDSMIITVIYVLVVWLLLALGRNLLADAFGAQGTAHELITFFCVFVAGSFLFNGILFVSNTAFNNLGFAFYSTALNWGRATLGVIPFVWLGAQWYGAKGALAGYGLGVVFFGVLAGVLCFRVLRQIEKQA